MLGDWRPRCSGCCACMQRMSACSHAVSNQKCTPRCAQAAAHLLQLQVEGVEQGGQVHQEGGQAGGSRTVQPHQLQPGLQAGADEAALQANRDEVEVAGCQVGLAGEQQPLRHHVSDDNGMGMGQQTAACGRVLGLLTAWCNAHATSALAVRSAAHAQNSHSIRRQAAPARSAGTEARSAGRRQTAPPGRPRPGG